MRDQKGVSMVLCNCPLFLAARQEESQHPDASFQNRKNNRHVIYHPHKQKYPLFVPMQSVNSSEWRQFFFSGKESNRRLRCQKCHKFCPLKLVLTLVSDYRISAFPMAGPNSITAHKATPNKSICIWAVFFVSFLLLSFFMHSM